MPKTAEAPSIGRKNAKWLEDAEYVCRQIADLSLDKQIAYFRYIEDGGRSNDIMVRSIQKYGRLTQEHVVAAIEMVRHTVAEFPDDLFGSLPAAGILRPLKNRNTRLTFLLNISFAELLWRVPIQDAHICAAELLSDRSVVGVRDYRGTSETVDMPAEMLPLIPFDDDERLVWVTEAACEEIGHAVADATATTLAADMFPAPAATVIFHVPVRIGSTDGISAIRWALGEYEGSDVVWVESTAAWMHTGLPLKRGACIPLGHTCDEFEDHLFVDNTDRLLWAVLQVAQSPLAQRPKIERSAVRRSDKRAMKKGFLGVSEMMHVIDLRRPRPGDEVPGGERHAHAHWVRGHTRQHWWPSLEQHVPTWIQTHVRGNPELGWAHGHTPDGPPKRQVVWRVRGDADQSPQRNSRSARKRRGLKVGAQ